MKPPVMKEHELQAQIVDALRASGFSVYETTAYRQKGSSGVDRGVPDLLVALDASIPGQFLGLEVKRPGKVRYSSIEQEEAAKKGHIVVVQSLGDVLTILATTLLEYPFQLMPALNDRYRKFKIICIQLDAMPRSEVVA
ncbi:MAG: hypothetical protein IT203_05260 [Fimbriimonadaceae bacterium]|nr:hypothetical protein [Fimbriimonadaceae bacterium]